MRRERDVLGCREALLKLRRGTTDLLDFVILHHPSINEEPHEKRTSGKRECVVRTDSKAGQLSRGVVDQPEEQIMHLFGLCRWWRFQR